MIDDYSKFVIQFKQRSGLDLSLYKEGQMKRRLSSLHEKKGYKNFAEFGQAMKRDEQLYLEVLDRVTINVSEFFRNAKRWKIIEQKILPNLLKNSSQLKIWSAACSTGEEPYTIAMILSHYFPTVKFSILATDIDEKAIARAKRGIYPERSLVEVPSDIKSKYFRPKSNQFEVAEQIKSTVNFKKHNMLAEVFDKNFDLIICRNVLIYFTDEAKEVLYVKFSESLKEEGILFVGSTEQIFNSGKYGLASEDTFIYKKLPSESD